MKWVYCSEVGPGPERSGGIYMVHETGDNIYNRILLYHWQESVTAL